MPPTLLCASARSICVPYSASPPAVITPQHGFIECCSLKRILVYIAHVCMHTASCIATNVLQESWLNYKETRLLFPFPAQNWLLRSTLYSWYILRGKDYIYPVLIQGIYNLDPRNFRKLGVLRISTKLMYH